MLLYLHGLSGAALIILCNLTFEQMQSSLLISTSFYARTDLPRSLIICWVLRTMKSVFLSITCALTVWSFFLWPMIIDRPSSRLNVLWGEIQDSHFILTRSFTCSIQGVHILTQRRLRHTHACAHTYMHTHACTQAHTYTHTHTLLYWLPKY